MIKFISNFKLPDPAVQNEKDYPNGPAAFHRNPQTMPELLEFIKPMGRWQIIILCAFSWVMFFQAMVNLSNVFFTYPQVHYCRIPELEEQSMYSIEQQKKYSYPIRDDKKGPKDCVMYDISYTDIEWTSNATINGQLVGDLTNATNHTTMKCEDGWIYERDVMRKTIIDKWNLVCKKKKNVAHTAMVYMVGFFVGSLFAGPLSDYLGRKTAIIFFGIESLAFNLAMTWSPSYKIFLILRFFTAIGNVGGWLCAFVLCQEITSQRHRTWIGGLFFLPYALGYTCLSLVAFIFRDWQHMNIFISIPLVFYFFMIWIIPESPRWLMAKQKVDKAMSVIERAAKWNGVQLHPGFTLDQIVDNILREEDEQQRNRVNFWDMLRYPVYIVRIVNLYFNWLVNTMVYYGLAWQISTFSGNLFLNNAISGAVEIPGYLVCVPLLMWGRKRALILTLLVAGVACLAASPVPERIFQLKLFFVFVGRFAITASFEIVYCYTSDLFPTVIRNTALASCSMVARIGSIVAPYILAIPDQAEEGSKLHERLSAVPIVIFGLFSLAATALTFLLPESRGEKIPERLPDGLVNQSDFERFISRVSKKHIHKNSAPITSVNYPQPDPSTPAYDTVFKL